MNPIYVLIDSTTGKFWKKDNRGARRGVHAYRSEGKARAVIKMTSSNTKNVVIVKYEATEHNS